MWRYIIKRVLIALALVLSVHPWIQEGLIGWVRKWIDG